MDFPRDVKVGSMGPIMLTLKLNCTLLTAMLRNLSKVKDQLTFWQSMQKVGTLMFSLVLGASSVLDRTYYLEFEYHMIGMSSFMYVYFFQLNISCNQQLFPNCTTNIHHLYCF